jgi:trafficking protein particle complex subunit 2
MSYYFCIVGTRDNPIYQADLASKPAGSSGPSSFFSSSSSNTTNLPSANTPNTASSIASQQTQIDPTTASSNVLQNATTNSTSGGVFGFGNALGAITGGLSAAAREARNTGQSGLSALQAGSGGNSEKSDGKGLGFGRYNDKHVLQMIAHSSLDVVEDKQFSSNNNSMYLKAVDRMNEWTTSAFIAPGNIKFLILHEHKHDDGIRNFFFDVWELFVKIMMNPFHDLNQPIQSASFDAKVRASARKHL